MGHSRQASATFPHVSLFTKGDDSAKMAPYGVVTDRHVFGPSFHCHRRMLGFTREANTSLESGFCQFFFLSTVSIGFHSEYQSTLIPVPPPIGCCDLKGFLLTLCFLLLSAGSFPGQYTQRVNGVPNEKADVIWTCFSGRSGLLTIRRALSLQNSRTFSFLLPYSLEMMFVDNSLDCVVSQRPLCGTLVRILRTLSLMFPYSLRMMIVLRWPLHSVVSDRNVLAIFVPL